MILRHFKAEIGSLSKPVGVTGTVKVAMSVVFKRDRFPRALVQIMVLSKPVGMIIGDHERQRGNNQRR
jgi:hypothetical protein